MANCFWTFLVQNCPLALCNFWILINLPTSIWQHLYRHWHPSFSRVCLQQDQVSIQPSFPASLPQQPCLLGLDTQTIILTSTDFFGSCLWIKVYFFDGWYRCSPKVENILSALLAFIVADFIYGKKFQCKKLLPPT